MAKKFKLGPLQRKWLRALKSGKYKQGKNYLAQNTKVGWRHCCLGVACEVLGVPGVTKSVSGLDRKVFGGDTSYAPDSVVCQLKLFDKYGTLDADVSGGDLVTVNDESHRGYAPIIKLIEESPECVFTEPA
jgi:hypothetical protein